MSASREKRLRKVTDGAVEKTPVKKNNKAKMWIIAVACLLVIAILVGVSLLFNSNWPHTHLTAATIGEYKLTAADMNYYYRSAYSSIASQYGDYAATLMPYMSEAVLEEALDYAHLNYAVYEVAVKEGYSLNEEEMAEINETIDMYSTVAPLLGFKDANEYMEYIYGKGCNTENYRTFYEMGTLAQRYLSDKVKAFTSTDAEKTAYYAEHKAELDLLSFRMYTISVTDTMTLDQATEAAKKMVDEAKADESSFDKNAYELAPEDKKTTYEAENATLLTAVKPSVLKQSISETSVVEWLASEDRVAGDATYLVKEDETLIYVLYFVERDDLDYTARTFRGILVTAGDAENAMETAKTEAQGYLDTYNAGDKTAEAFGKLAEEKSDDSVAGGLYESMGRSDLPTSVKDWVYSADRAEGDVAMIEFEEGYYVVYYVGEGDNYRSVIAGDALQNQYYTDLVAEMKATVEATVVTPGINYITTETAATYYE